ncbi:MAG: hypothetical protein JNL64_13060 [Blastocatellia bacterium]|jgi:hypothetical protein|nr:hypothetical protein [Blastocatellia bacterium]
MSKAESAELILKLYDLRREPVMRKARDWMFNFNPKTAEEYMATMMDPEVGAYVRMVVSYWDMAAAMVVEGAIDADLFNKTNGEHTIIYAKLEPILADLRAIWQRPEALSSLEKVVLDAPGGAEMVKQTQEWLKNIQEQMAAAQSS